MKTITLTTLALVTFTMLTADSAEAQNGYYGNSINWNQTPSTSPNYSSRYATPQSNYVLPPSTSPYGNSYTNSYSNSNCPNGRCGTSSSYGTYPATTGYQNGYAANSGSFFGTLGSWLGVRPATNAAYPNGYCADCQDGRCATHQPVRPYTPAAPYGNYGYPTLTNYGGSSATGPYYNY